MGKKSEVTVSEFVLFYLLSSLRNFLILCYHSVMDLINNKINSTCGQWYYIQSQ